MSSYASREHLDEIHRLELAVGHIEEALKHAFTYAMKHDSGWELVADLQKSYTRYQNALGKRRQKLTAVSTRRELAGTAV